MSSQTGRSKGARADHAASGIALKLAAAAAFTLMNMLAKLAGPVPVGEIVFFRSLFALVPLFALSIFTVGPLGVVTTERPLAHLIRSAIGMGSVFFGFGAVKALPLADVTAFGFVMPIFAVIFAALFLREKVGPYRGAAIVIAFGGVLLMIAPQGGLFHVIASGLSTGAGLALGNALLSAIAVTFIRQISGTEKSETIVFYFMGSAAVAGAVTMIWFHAALSPLTWVWLVACGILGGVGQICMTFSYRYAAPSLLAPFDYTGMIWATILGYAVFGEIPERLVLAGAAIVIAAGLFIVWREYRLGEEPGPGTAVL